ncbi:MAG: gliding motility-associated C-terminal domain-containing protein [Flavipsychrobacter sp.]|nr:gliding motility-associated C-terminal domain-containing protein [Flavipsychrobacter sp.]
MKKTVHTAILLIAFLSIHLNANASHYAGAELTYRWVHDSTYHFTYKIYRDCAGLSGSNVVPNGVMTLCCHNTCGTTNDTSVDLTADNILPDGRPNCSPVSTGCGGVASQCDNPGSPNHSDLDGYQECWYEGDFTIPARCAQWTFSVWANSRNTSQITNLNTSGNQNIYTEATLNNVVAQGNSSVDFTVKPVPFVCINNQYVYNNGAVDIDNDSLAFALVQPRSSPTVCGAPSNIPYKPATPPYNLTTNPLADNNTFTLSPTTGQLQFTPNQTGQYVVALQVTEYRNHIAIATTVRDIQIYVLANCSIQPPPFTPDSVNISGGYLNNGIIENCANVPLNFCFKSKSANAAAVLVVSDNHLQQAPGSTITYSGQQTDSVTGCFSWTPSNADTGLKILTITIKDSTCSAGIAIAETYSIPIYVNPNIRASNDTSICLGSSVALFAVGSTSFTWSVLPGGSPISSLSCTNCANPVATPSVTTKYVVTSNVTTSTSCNSTDTVIVSVNTVPSKPLPTSNSPLCANTTMDLYAGTTANSYIWTGPAGFNSVVQNPVVNNIQVPNTGWYHVRAKNGNCISAADSVYVTVTVTPKFPIITGNSPICSGGTINLFAQSSNNVNYNWTGPNGFTSGSQNVIIQNAGTQYSGTYNVTASYPSNSACVTAAASYTVAVSAGIFADFHFSKDSICQYDAVSINYNSGGSDSLLWSFASGIPLDTLADNPISVKFLLPGTQTVTLTAADSGCIDIVSHTIHVYDAPPSTFSAPAITCFGDPITVVSNNDFNHNVQFNWNFGVATVLSGTGEGPYALQYAQPGTYQVTLITQNPNCTSPLIIDTLLVDAIPSAAITTADINNICSDDSVHFDGVAVSGSHYQWIQSRIFANDTLSSTYALVRNAGYIYLNVVDTFGCKASDSLYFTPHPCCIVSFPTAFTPNEDGKNDVFRPITTGHHDIAYFRVFNRWGQLVYSSREEQKGWDGKYNGIPLDAGDYYFTMKYRCVDGEYFEEKGEVMLIR